MSMSTESGGLRALDGKELFTIEGSENWRSNPDNLEEREKWGRTAKKTSHRHSRHMVRLSMNCASRTCTTGTSITLSVNCNWRISMVFRTVETMRIACVTTGMSMSTESGGLRALDGKELFTIEGSENWRSRCNKTVQTTWRSAKNGTCKNRKKKKSSHRHSRHMVRLSMNCASRTCTTGTSITLSVNCNWRISMVFRTVPANHAEPGWCVASDHFCRCGGSPH